jgi:hypothetical protein
MIPKSLHTVTALVNVARYIRTPTGTAEDAVIRATILLGYTDAPDPHGLIARAIAALAKGA